MFVFERRQRLRKRLERIHEDDELKHEQRKRKWWSVVLDLLLLTFYSFVCLLIRRRWVDWAGASEAAYSGQSCTEVGNVLRDSLLRQKLSHLQIVQQIPSQFF